MNNRLELNWIGKYENKISPEPRIMYENAEYSYAKEQAGQIEIEEATKPTYGNLLIHGDNLLALKALESEYAGKVKCIYIDPPYNTGAVFEHYDDGVEHSLWLNLMKPRLEIMRALLCDEGSIWISIDDTECHYLKVLCDEVFGRMNFVTSIAWRSADSSNNDSKKFSSDHNHILVYSKKPDWVSIPLPRTEESNGHYKNPDNDPRGPWFSGNVSSPNPRPNLRYVVKSPIGNTIEPPANGWRWKEEKMLEMIENKEVVFSQDGTRIIKKTYLSEQKGLSPSSIWDDINDTGHNRQAKYELIKLFPDIPTAELFKTPKPERVIKKVLMIATNPGDLILDSFLGSGTTAAVAHKMGRRWIGIELGNHAYTHCYPRLKAVVDGEQGGISKSVNWQGGGGFKFLELAPSLLELDENGRYIISQEYNSVALAAAMAMHKGYKFAPDENVYWKQGRQNEHNYIFTTTNYIYGEYLDKLFSEMEENETLLICCRAFAKECNARCKLYKRIRVQKIPDILFGRCEFGKDNYDLNIIAQDIIDDTDDYEGEDE